MKQDEIIEMAKEAGASRFFSKDSVELGLTSTAKIEAFAKLVAAKERETIIDEYWSCIQSDLEHGVKSLNQKATEDFYQKMPELSKFGRWLEARG
jgi:hypothetical protein